MRITCILYCMMSLSILIFGLLYNQGYESIDCICLWNIVVRLLYKENMNIYK